jgi:hypothetical protein
MEPTVEASPPILTPPADASSFEVGGITYTATDGLSVARLRIFQRLGIEFGADNTLKGLIAGIDGMWQALNEMKLADAIHTLGKLREGLDITGANRVKDIEICALFFNAPNEDPGTYDFQAMQRKVEAWGAVHSGFFLVAALRLLPTSPGSYLRTAAPTPVDAPAPSDSTT